jgi:excisionase family DNA binding protein
MTAPPTGASLAVDSCPSEAEFADIVRRFELTKRVYSRAELPEVLGVSESFIDRLLRDGLLRFSKTGERSVKITRVDVVDFLWRRDRRPRSA